MLWGSPVEFWNGLGWFGNQELNGDVSPKQVGDEVKTYDFPTSIRDEHAISNCVGANARISDPCRYHYSNRLK